MCEVPVFYATTDGQTRRIATRIASTLRDLGLESDAIDLTSNEAPSVPWERVRGAILGASLHAGGHQRYAAAFARTHRQELNERPSAFFSVSLSAASKNPREVAAAEALAKDFVEKTGWHPNAVVCIAGRLAYTQYGFLKRLILRQIAKKEGASTDTSRDHEFTDWDKVATIAKEIARDIRREEDEALTYRRQAG
jgi:menaquinone-dependent protoporphyrinogen oxidase